VDIQFEALRSVDEILLDVADLTVAKIEELHSHKLLKALNFHLCIYYTIFLFAIKNGVIGDLIVCYWRQDGVWSDLDSGAPPCPPSR